MSFRRYIAGTVREAMERVRRELGEDAVILSNKRLGPGRIEIVAAGPDSMEALVEQADRPAVAAAPAARPAAREPARAREAQRPAAESFQEFIRRQAAPATVQRELPAMAESQPAPVARVAALAPSRPSPRPASRPAPQPAARAEAAMAAARTAGVEMYNEVARVHAETRQPIPAEAVRAPGRAAAAALQPAIEMGAPPAVFRRREAEAPAAVATRYAPEPMDSYEDEDEPFQAQPLPPVAQPLPPKVQPLPLKAEPVAIKPEPVLLNAAPAAVAAVPVAPAIPAAPVAAAPGADSQVMNELRALRAALSDRISALESNLSSTMSAGGAGPSTQAPLERNAATTRVMTRLLMSGFSPEVSRKIAQHAPVTRDADATDSWMHQVIAGNLRCATAAESLTEIRGAVALVGPTGVGKTTTVAKLASRFAVRYGVGQLGLVTLDSYRIGAHDQLRGYSRILGVPMHVAQDGATLRELLASLQAKRLVLIDTCGLSQRDERMQEMMAILRAARFNAAPLRPVLLLNAASNAETLDEVARAWNGQQAAGAVLTKLDEAARIGGAVDCLLRYRMMLYGLTNGQRVPEDWHQAGASLIAHVALKPSASPFALADAEALAWSEQPQGSLNA